MTKLRIGLVLVAYAVIFAVAFLVASDTFTTLGPQGSTRGDYVTYFAFGYILPLLAIVVGSILAVFGLRQVGRERAARSKDQAPDFRPRSPLFEVFPIPALVVLVGAGVYLGYFAYGGGEIFSSPPLVHLGARLVEHWSACEETRVTGADIALLIERGEWHEAEVRRCADCLDAHPRCNDREACHEACADPAGPLPTLAEFGGRVEPAFYGTWELVNGGSTHARMIYDAVGFQKILDGDSNTVRGEWRARAGDATGTWEILHVPTGRDSARWIETVEVTGNTRMRWLDGGMEFELQRPQEVVDAGPSQDRINECRRACSRWRSCMRDYQDSYMCQEDMTRSCRECRDQGLGR